MNTAPSEARERIALPFLRNIWYVAGWASEFDSPGPLGRMIADEPIVLYRKRDGKLVALADRCAHRWAQLSFGRVEGDDLRCMYHGAKFAADGRCVEIPGQDRIAKMFCVRSYPVIEKHRFTWIWMGIPALADPNLIPDLSMLDQPWRRIYHGSLDYEANYSLINDNLLDLSHIAFLHEKTVGRPVVTASESHVQPYTAGGSEAKPLERGVRVESWVSGPLARNVLLPRQIPDGDLWSRTDFLAPGIFISYEQMYPAGTAEACKGLPPGAEREPLSDSMSIQAVTPIAARKTRYFYSFGPRASDVEKEESDAMWEIVKDTFAEDLRMIQAQQKIIDAHPGQRMGGIAADRGLVLFRNLMKKFIAAETPPAVTTNAPALAS
jgi:phenylpropionate dioxygenase-like ring-hydroxylating dioxygenase large terminal subunit